MRRRRRRPAPRVLSRSRRPGSVDLRPSIELTAIGKKLTSAITITFGRMSMPVQMTIIGAITGIGTICEITSQG